MNLLGWANTYSFSLFIWNIFALPTFLAGFMISSSSISFIALHTVFLDSSLRRPHLVMSNRRCQWKIKVILAIFSLSLLIAYFKAFSAIFETFKPKALASLKTTSSTLIEVNNRFPIYTTVTL